MNIEDYFLKEDLFEIFTKVFENLTNKYLKIFTDLEIESRLVAQRYRLQIKYMDYLTLHLESKKN